jgi:hypothetical protein
MQQYQLIDESSMDNIIDEIIKLNKSHRFASELSHTNDTTRKNDLNEIIKVLDGTSKVDFQVLGKNKLTKIWESMDSHTLHGKWTKLSVQQKKDRIKLFLIENVKNIEKRKEAESMLFTLVDTKKLKKNAVSYDQENGKIMSINIKEYDKLMEQKNNSENNSENNSDSE